jgi:diamine N-acetyltransferase
MSLEQPELKKEAPVTPLRIRPATEADIVGIRAIAEAAWPVAFGSIVSADFLRHELNREYSDAALHHQMQELGHRFLMAEQPTDANGVLTVGFVSYGFQDELEGPETTQVATVYKLYLMPQLKGKGHGATLLNAAVAAARQAGCARIELSVNRQNPAIRFYQRQGFSIVCERDIEVGPGFVRSDYLMAKALGQD